MTSYPKNQMVIDLSHWNSVQDWKAVRASGVVGVIHKFSQGTSNKDPAYQSNRANAIAANLLWGRYHFADASPVAQQVANFLTGWQAGELLALDWENTTDGTASLADAEAFVTAVFSQTGQVPVLYSGNVVKEALKAGPSTVLSGCRLWLAQYANQPVLPPGWNAAWLWQWTNNGTCGGISGAVDLDSYMGSEAELRAAWTDVPSIPAPPVVTETETVTVTITVPKGSRVVINTTGPVDGVTT